jgi:hypothetical protein
MYHSSLLLKFNIQIDHKIMTRSHAGIFKQLRATSIENY